METKNYLINGIPGKNEEEFGEYKEKIKITLFLI